MTRLRLLALLPLAISSVAFAAAEATGSEYQHMAASGKWEVTPQIEYHSWAVKSDLAAGTKSTATGMNYGVNGEYGLSDMFSVGANISFTSEKTKVDGSTTGDITGSGMNDIHLYGNGKYDLGGSMIRYGLDLGFSAGKKKSDATSYSTNTGGMSLTPFVGWEMAMGPGILGAKFTYSFLLGDRSFDVSPAATTNLDKENGESRQSLAVFYEWMQNNWSLGLALSYNGVSGAKQTLVNGTSGAADAGHAGLFAQVYAPIVLADDITLLPAIGFGDNGQSFPGTSNVKSVNGWDLAVGCRFGF